MVDEVVVDVDVVVVDVVEGIMGRVGGGGGVGGWWWWWEWGSSRWCRCRASGSTPIDRPAPTSPRSPPTASSTALTFSLAKWAPTGGGQGPPGPRRARGRRRRLARLVLRPSSVPS